MAVKPIPEGYHSVTPYLALDDAAGAIEYYKKAFGAKERGRMEGPDGKIAHAELAIGDSVVMLSDPFPQFLARPPKDLGGTSASVFLYVEDVDAFVKQAVDAGATVEMEVADRSGATASAPSRIRSATCGPLRRTSRTSRLRRWRSAPRRPWRQ
jgi:PhnB protein